MTDFTRYGLVALIMLLTHAQEGITGFGSSAIALPFIILLLGFHSPVPVVVLLAWVTAICIVSGSRQRIVWSEYVRILVLMGVGLPFGIWMSGILPEQVLKLTLAAFMSFVGAHGLVCQSKKSHLLAQPSRRTRLLAAGLLPIGGIIHGAFGTGGPLIITYATRALPNKSLFRATLCLVWITINIAMISQWIVRSVIDAHILRIVGVCLPFTLFGLFIGNHIHHRIDEFTFRRMVYWMLILAGITVALNAVLH
jgi:uncharacterized protein